VQHMQVKWSERASGSGNQVGLKETFTVELIVLRRPLRGNAKTGHDRHLLHPFIQFRLIFTYAHILYNLYSWNSVVIFVSKEHKSLFLPYMYVHDLPHAGMVRRVPRVDW
jgi:hypothetical protein